MKKDFNKDDHLSKTMKDVNLTTYKGTTCDVKKILDVGIREYDDALRRLSKN